MSNTYFTWDKFVKNFGREMRIAGEIFDNMAGSGLKDGCLCCFDFTFLSNRRENLERLGQYLKSHYLYSIAGIKPNGAEWDLDGKTGEIPVNANNLMYWALDMSKRGYEFDADFDAYGAPFDPADQRLRSDFRSELRTLIPMFLNPTRATHHYRSIAKQALSNLTSENQISIKKLLYAARALLACRWIRQYKSQPPTEFNVVVEHVASVDERSKGPVWAHGL